MDYEHPLDHPGDEPAPAFSARAFVRGRNAVLSHRSATFSWPAIAVFLEDSPDELTIFDERLWLALRNKLEPLDPLAEEIKLPLYVPDDAQAVLEDALRTILSEEVERIRSRLGTLDETQTQANLRLLGQFDLPDVGGVEDDPMLHLAVTDARNMGEPDEGWRFDWCTEPVKVNNKRHVAVSLNLDPLPKRMVDAVASPRLHLYLLSWLARTYMLRGGKHLGFPPVAE